MDEPITFIDLDVRKATISVGIAEAGRLTASVQEPRHEAWLTPVSPRSASTH